MWDTATYWFDVRPGDGADGIRQHLLWAFRASHPQVETYVEVVVFYHGTDNNYRDCRPIVDFCFSRCDGLVYHYCSWLHSSIKRH